MGIKFDGKNVKKRSRVVANMRNNTELNKGFGTGQVLGNIKRRNVIKSGRNTSGVSLCNIKDGENIRFGSSSSGKFLINYDYPRASGLRLLSMHILKTYIFSQMFLVIKDMI